ncbi:sensor histidine kinase [Devosia sp.]|uniref:sensor histidine kinase n=1 Tax=Devosia sp. TaxID=1871048 RepID=UPI003A8F8E57
MAARPQTLSLTSRLAVAGLAIVLVGGVIVTVLAWSNGQRAAQQAFDRLLLGAAEQISASISLSDGELLVDVPATAFDLLALSRNDRVVYRVAEATGETLTGYERVPLPELATGQSFYSGDITGEAARFVAVSRNFAERDFSGSTITIVGLTLNARNALAWDIMQNAWLILLLAGIGMTALALFAMRSALEPLRRVSQHLLARDPEDLSPIDLQVPRELSAFIAAFNRFAGRIERQMRVMQDLIADSAHQLRTPIAALRATTRNAAEDTTTTQERATLEKIDRQAARLGRLTDQLLSRALVIHRADAGRLARLDLRHVASEAVETVDALVPQGQAIRLELPETPVMIEGDATSLIEAVKNLISNAIAHGQAPYEVRVMTTAGSARLAVIDSGPGMDAKQWRNRSRRFGKKGEHGRPSGLGLSIVRAVMLAHDAQIETGNPGADKFQVVLIFALRMTAFGRDDDD